VAHNGDQYDFPLLKAEMEKVGTKLESQILCVECGFLSGNKRNFQKKGKCLFN
jgi:DNA polymerase elongation subunit (family B)